MSKDSKFPQKTSSLPWTESIGGHTSDRDEEIWERLESTVSDNGHPVRHVLELFPSYVRRMHMTRFLAHYDLFKHVIDLPGNIIEIGVYRGSSLLTWGKLMETFCPTDRSRRVYGFDNFKGLQDFDEKDGKKEERCGKTEGGWCADPVRDEVFELVDIANKDNLIEASKRTILIEGDIEETLPQFLEAMPGLRISLLHMDIDLYKPTKFALEQLYPRVVVGGVVVFDEYGIVPWEGETIAAEEYFKEIGISPKIEKFPYTHLPHGYFIKEEL